MFKILIIFILSNIQFIYGKSELCKFHQSRGICHRICIYLMILAEELIKMSQRCVHKRQIFFSFISSRPAVFKVHLDVHWKDIFEAVDVKMLGVHQVSCDQPDVAQLRAACFPLKGEGVFFEDFLCGRILDDSYCCHLFNPVILNPCFCHFCVTSLRLISRYYHGFDILSIHFFEIHKLNFSIPYATRTKLRLHLQQRYIPGFFTALHSVLYFHFAPHSGQAIAYLLEASMRFLFAL